MLALCSGKRVSSKVMTIVFLREDGMRRWKENVVENKEETPK